MPSPEKYPDELRERAVRFVAESGRPIACRHGSRRARRGARQCGEL